MTALLPLEQSYIASIRVRTLPEWLFPRILSSLCCRYPTATRNVLYSHGS